MTALERRMTVYRVRRFQRDGFIKETRTFLTGAAARRRAHLWRTRGWRVTVHRSSAPVVFIPVEKHPRGGDPT